MSDSSARTRHVAPVPQQETETTVIMVHSWKPLVVTGFLGLVYAAVLAGAGYLILQQYEKMDRATAAVTSEIIQLKRQVASLRSQLLTSTTEEMIFLKVMVMNPSVRTEMAREVADAVFRHSKKFGRHPELALAIIEVESNFHKRAVSSAGAVGLMQVMPKWKDILGLTGDLSEIDTNIHHGLQILGFYQETHGGDLRLALAAYNRGPERVRADLIAGRDPHRNGYAEKVLTARERLRQMRKD